MIFIILDSIMSMCLMKFQILDMYYNNRITYQAKNPYIITRTYKTEKFLEHDHSSIEILIRYNTIQQQ